MPQVDVVDETWIRADPADVAARVADPANWRRWWPSLELTVDELRGAEGVRWKLASGSMEIWLQPDLDGVRLHYFLRLDPADGRRLAPRQADRQVMAHRRRAKRVFWTLKDELEGRR
jgi:Polyketide cyclase / dehydrase and lipid transport